MFAHGESPLLSVGEVALILNVKQEAAINRLNDWGVPSFKIGKVNFVTRFDFEVALGIIHANALKSKYPTCWQERYRLSQANPAIVELVFKDMGMSISAPTTKVKAQSESSKKLLNKLTS